MARTLQDVAPLPLPVGCSRFGKEATNVISRPSRRSPIVVAVLAAFSDSMSSGNMALRD
eukprot:CAMPEP_0173114436 /NCGR_PEP_ID=MMETSP1102-20130122/47655_1 /TAXON_ID=49646 /ORGANISM="Geminigera sp., Strain Caron Lab Isolate" /LENGTH=58 /DNA_ID=CAMNT_0014016783 /DNA_START=456 /DNA_END=629 /DNA_ORIENTATION=-